MVRYFRQLSGILVLFLLSQVIAQEPTSKVANQLPVLEDTEDHDRLFDVLHHARRLAESGAGYEAARVVAAIALQAEGTEPAEEALACLQAWKLEVQEVSSGEPAAINLAVAQNLGRRTDDGASDTRIRNLLELNLIPMAVAALQASPRRVELLQRFGREIEDGSKVTDSEVARTLAAARDSILLKREARLLWGIDHEAAELAHQMLEMLHPRYSRDEGSDEHEEFARWVEGREPEEEQQRDRDHKRTNREDELDELLTHVTHRIMRLRKENPRAARILSRLVIQVAPESLASETARAVLKRTENTQQATPSPLVRSVVGKDPGAEFFEDQSVHNYRLELSDAAIEHLHEAPKEYVHATFREGQDVYRNVGVRLKGGWGSFRMIGGREKPGFTIKFNQFEKEQRFHGLRRIVLNNSVQDPSHLCEYLGYGVFRDAGVPAPRVSFARLSVNGQSYGLYNQIEAVTQDFLSRWFSETGGNLYEGPGDVSNWEELDLDSNQAKPNRNDLRGLSHAIEEADDEDPWPILAKKVDVDQLARFVALEQLVAHWDGYMQVNNYRIYSDPESQKFHFFPHGCDQIFEDVSHDVFEGQNGILGRALLQTESGVEKYRNALQWLLIHVWDEQVIRQRLADAYSQIYPVLEEAQDVGEPNSDEFEHHVQSILRFVAFRRVAVEHFLSRHGKRASWKEHEHDEGLHFLHDDDWD